MSKSRITLHQVTDSAVPGDAITDQALTLQRWLRELGYKSDIYSLHCAESLATQIKPLNQYKPGRNERFLIYHHGVGSDVVNMLVDIGVPLILFYHNITPPEFYANVDPALANELIHGRSQLQTIRTKAVLGLGASEYSVLELENSGFIKTGILPIAIDESDYNAPSSDVLLDNYRDKRPLLLFVGRLAPNKRQEDLIKLLYYLRRISPGAHLLLVGRIHHKDYHSWLTHLCANLGLKDAVTFTNHVSQEEMVTYYRMADLFVSMSEHEGFGKPLIESMYFEVPVMAYASTAIPSTMGDAGVLFHDKDYEALAEVADLILQDDKLRARLVAGQNRRVADFLETSIKRQLQRIMEDLEYLPEGGANGSRGHRASVSSNHAVSEIKKEANELDLESQPVDEFFASLMEQLQLAWYKREPKQYERLAPALRHWADKLVAIRIDEFQAHLATMDREESQLAHQIAELTAHLVQLDRRVEQLEADLHHVQARQVTDRQEQGERLKRTQTHFIGRESDLPSKTFCQLVLKITYFSPLFPAPAGIADYSRDLLPSLSEKVDLNLFAEDPAGVDSTLHEQFPVEPIAAYPDKRWDSDLAWQIRLGRRMRPVQSVHFSKRIVDRSPSIIVHSHDAAERFSRRSVACPVAVIPHLVAGADGSLLRHRLELPDRTVLFATTGLVNASKRIDLALDAFVRLKQAEPNVFFLIVGGVHTDVNLPKMIHQRRLQDSVHCTGRVAIEELNGWVAAADVVIALRHPTLGETSGAAVRALSTGKPLIVFDDGWYGELPAEICLQIPPWMLMR